MTLLQDDVDASEGRLHPDDFIPPLLAFGNVLDFRNDDGSGGGGGRGRAGRVQWGGGPEGGGGCTIVVVNITYRRLFVSC